MTFTELAPAPSDPSEPFTDRLRLVVAAYLARFKGSSREHTKSDPRCYLTWCAEHGLDPLAAQRPHLELYIRWMQEIRRFKPSTVSRSSLAPSYVCPAPVAPGGQSMTNYARMYRFGITPWERYATAAAASIAALLDREEAGRSRPLGRALDLGCGRGLFTPALARRGWQAVGIDYVPAAIEAAAAKSPGAAGLSYVVGDVTRLPSARLGTFDFFLDIGCFQGLDAGQRLAQGEGLCALANPGATLLLLSFGPSRWRRLVEGASQEEVETAFAGWEILTSERADTAGLGWPMNTTAPRWYRLRRRT